jgi:hypothetical protein
MQARMEAVQIKIQERLKTTLLKTKDQGYQGLETCASNQVRANNEPVDTFRLHTTAVATMALLEANFPTLYIKVTRGRN